VKRLWHQLTEVLLALVQRPELQDGDKLWQLYTNVIADFELKYVEDFNAFLKCFIAINSSSMFVPFLLTG